MLSYRGMVFRQPGAKSGRSYRLTGVVIAPVNSLLPEIGGTEDVAADIRTAGLTLDYHNMYTTFIVDALPATYGVEARNMAYRDNSGREEISKTIREQHHRLSGNIINGSNAGQMMYSDGGAHMMYSDGGVDGNRWRGGGCERGGGRRRGESGRWVLVVRYNYYATQSTLTEWSDRVSLLPNKLYTCLSSTRSSH